MMRMIMCLMCDCTTMEDFDDSIDVMKLAKETRVVGDKDGYYCRICFNGLKPNFNVQQPGAFYF